MLNYEVGPELLESLVPPRGRDRPADHAASGTVIHVVTAPAFLATKLEAFVGRGANNHLFSHDLGDLISIVDGRDTLLAECEQAPADLCQYLAERFTALLRTRAFIDALPGHLPGDAASQGRLPDLELRLRQLAGLGARPSRQR